MWTIEQVLEESKKYTSLTQWRGNKSLSSAASRLQVYNEATAHIVRTRKACKDVCYDDIKILFSACSSRKDAQLRYPGLYKKLTKEQLSVIFGIPHTAKRKYTDSNLIAIAKQYTTRNDLKRSDVNVYNTIKHRGLTKAAFAHMGPAKCVKKSLEDLQKAASQFTTKNSFKLGNYGAYQAACKHSEFSTICEHMVPGAAATNYHKALYLYVVKITTLDSSLPVVYKIGITKRSRILDRFWIDYEKNKTRIDVLFSHRFNHGREAYLIEQQIKADFSKYKYIGPSPLLRTRTTEMFNIPPLSSPLVGLRKCSPSGAPLE